MSMQASMWLQISLNAAGRQQLRHVDQQLRSLIILELHHRSETARYNLCVSGSVAAPGVLSAKRQFCLQHSKHAGDHFTGLIASGLPEAFADHVVHLNEL